MQNTVSSMKPGWLKQQKSQILIAVVIAVAIVIAVIIIASVLAIVLLTRKQEPNDGMKTHISGSTNPLSNALVLLVLKVCVPSLILFAFGNS